MDLMQQYTFDVLIQEEEERLNMSKREEVVPRYRSTSHFYYRDGLENKEFKQRVHNFEPMIHYVIEQEAATQGIKMSRGIELILVTRQETIVLPRAKLTVVEHVPMAIRLRYNEPKFN